MINFYGLEKKYEELINKVYLETLRYFGQENDVFEIDLEGVSKDEIKEINLSERGVDKETDVLSFQNIVGLSLPCNVEDYPMDVDYESGKIMLGDILVCIDVMKEQAIEYGHSEEREVAYLALHGILHLLGYDHENEADKQVMRKHEEAILGCLDIVR